ncbi:MAG: hypothetical protein Q8P07_00720 [bacterium]|nr:hypothetical protein [bacterium]
MKPALNTEINKKIIKLWRKQFGASENVCAPFLYGNFVQDSLLFIGCNPSFSEKGFRDFLRNGNEKLDPKVFFKWANIYANSDNIAKCIEIDRAAFEYYDAYFKKLKEISNEVRLPWEHADLFLYRQTSQKDFKQHIMNKKNLNEFGESQIKIFREVLDAMRPKIIVVANAFASQIFQNEFSKEISFDNAYGWHWFKNKIPIFFSSMLSGQRALDRGSYERLKWHIGQAAIYCKKST